MITIVEKSDNSLLDIYYQGIIMSTICKYEYHSLIDKIHDRYTRLGRVIAVISHHKRNTPWLGMA